MRKTQNKMLFYAEKQRSRYQFSLFDYKKINKNQFCCCCFQLSGDWLKSLKGPQYIPLSHQFSSRLSLSEATPAEDLSLCISFRYISHDVTLRRPALRGNSLTIFGVPIEEV